MTATATVVALSTHTGPSLRGPLVVWCIWSAVCGATWVTYARTPVSDLYGVAGSGIGAGAGRTLVLLGWPISLVALGYLPLVVDRFAYRPAAIVLALASAASCATMFAVVDPHHLDAHLRNVPAGVGAVTAAALTAAAAATTRGAPPPRGTKRVVVGAAVAVVVLLASLPWLLANLGVYAGDVPVLRDIFMSKQVRPEAGYPHLAAVHLGNHDGFDGVLLALSAAVGLRLVPRLRLRSLRILALGYLSVLLFYGLAAAVTDFWTEQVVKRGTSSFRLPDLKMPSLGLGWAVIVALSVALTLVLRKRRQRA